MHLDFGVIIDREIFGQAVAEGLTTSDPTGIDSTANIGSTFTGWTGSGCSGSGVCVVTMDTPRSITATFTIDTYTLSITNAATGVGTVTCNPSGIMCGETCSAEFDYNTKITLTVSARTGSPFMGWSESGCSGIGVFVVTMDSAKSVIAKFSIKTYALTANKTGPGNGTVTSMSSGIDCGLTCKANFTYSNVLTLTAIPASESTFTSWKGSGCTGIGVCIVTMDAAKSVSATFEKIR